MKNKGFTIIELVMVMVILGIIGVLVMTPKAYLGVAMETGAAAKIKSDIRYVQGYALSTQNRTWVAFDTASGKYRVCDNLGTIRHPMPSNIRCKDGEFIGDRFIVDLNIDYPGVNIAQINFNGAGNSLLFNSAGRPYSCNSSGSGETLLSAQGTVTLGGGTEIRVYPNTGMVE